MKNNDFVWLHEAADIIGVHPTTITHWIEKKKRIDEKNPSDLTKSEKNFMCPPYTRIGARYRFNREELEKFIQDPLKTLMKE